MAIALEMTWMLVKICCMCYIYILDFNAVVRGKGPTISLTIFMLLSVEMVIFWIYWVKSLKFTPPVSFCSLHVATRKCGVTPDSYTCGLLRKQRLLHGGNPELDRREMHNVKVLWKVCLDWKHPLHRQPSMQNIQMWVRKNRRQQRQKQLLVVLFH